MFIIQVQQRLRLFPPAAARVRAETAEAWHRPWNALRRRRAYVYDDVTYVYDDVTYMYDDVTYVALGMPSAAGAHINK